jgi:hypothetical protein
MIHCSLATCSTVPVLLSIPYNPKENNNMRFLDGSGADGVGLINGMRM